MIGMPWLEFLFRTLPWSNLGTPKTGGDKEWFHFTCRSRVWWLWCFLFIYLFQHRDSAHKMKLLNCSSHDDVFNWVCPIVSSKRSEGLSDFWSRYSIITMDQNRKIGLLSKTSKTDRPVSDGKEGKKQKKKTEKQKSDGQKNTRFPFGQPASSLQLRGARLNRFGPTSQLSTFCFGPRCQGDYRVRSTCCSFWFFFALFFSGPFIFAFCLSASPLLLSLSHTVNVDMWRQRFQGLGRMMLCA